MPRVYHRKWSILGLNLSITFALALAGWEVLGWWKYSHIDRDGFVAWMWKPVYPSFTLNISNLGEMIMWTLGNTLPFFISMQVWICFVVLTVMLRDSVQALVRTLEEGIETPVGGGTSSSPRPSRGKKVTELIREYEKIADFNDCLNGTMGLTFWFLYYLDLFTVLGQVTGFTAGYRETPFDTLEDVTGTVLWLCFLVMMMRPCIAAHETAKEIPKILYMQLVESITTLDSPEGEEYVAAMTALMTTSRSRKIMLNGNGLLMGTRSALVAIFYLIGTFLIIFDEIMEVMPK
ncbi:hypothetical protein BV898_17682 [Hypsibius exemplaris]|uniref:Uncharacterized protein n=1 Tax=Hypsibius exemplaris TaxID=2072580 RepID=A0A9X6NFJ5_HYPEX|nr:hypothetical protein BV898_17682 [Hypsibius exemplaris]